MTQGDKARGAASVKLTTDVVKRLQTDETSALTRSDPLVLT